MSFTEQELEYLRGSPIFFPLRVRQQDWVDDFKLLFFNLPEFDFSVEEFLSTRQLVNSRLFGWSDREGGKE